MIHSFRLYLSAEDARKLSWSDAYRLYAWLLEQLPEASAEAIHRQNAHLLAQSVRYDPQREKNLWTVSVFDDALSEMLRPALLGAESVVLNDSGALRVEPAGETAVRARDLIIRNDGEPRRRAEIQFLTPTAFKQAGRYAIFPQESLVLQSLVGSWNAIFPEATLQDEDAYQALLQGLRVADYRLNTARFFLKGNKIPGFVGSAAIDSRLSLPLGELWEALLGLVPYAGIGIKTALGMGAAEVLRR